MPGPAAPLPPVPLQPNGAEPWLLPGGAHFVLPAELPPLQEDPLDRRGIHTRASALRGGHHPVLVRAVHRTHTGDLSRTHAELRRADDHREASQALNPQHLCLAARLLFLFPSLVKFVGRIDEIRRPSVLQGVVERAHDRRVLAHLEHARAPLDHETLLLPAAADGREQNPGHSAGLYLLRCHARAGHFGAFPLHRLSRVFRHDGTSSHDHHHKIH
mmetsp:Transcript_9841/g.21900  ORF Transcript_9841/g.21900 Transcript_9841/m.21900 type:complete len:216 (-) Transcript_9841:1082-1729(-)